MSEPIVRALRIALLLTTLAMSSIEHLHAQARQGALEVGINAGPFLLMASGGRETIGVLGLFGEPRVDYFIFDKLEVGVTGFFYRSLDSDPSLPSVSFGGAYGHVNYHFNAGNTVSPYIGIRLGAFTHNAVSVFGLGPQFGLKFFVTRELSINGQLSAAVYPTSEGAAFLSCFGLGLSYHIQ